jgi:hypothetical protein
LRKRASLLTALAASAAIGALVACGPAATPTPVAKTGTTGGTTATTPSAGSAVTTPATKPSPAAAMTGTPGAATTAGTPGVAGTGTPMAGTTGATGAATGTPMAGTTGATGAATGTPMAGTTGQAPSAGTPNVPTGINQLTPVGTGTPMAATSGTGASATGTPAASGATGTTGAMATGTPMAGTTGTGAMAGMPQIRIMQSISLQNPTPLSIDMSNWKLRIGSQTVSLPSNARVGPNEVVTIHFGEGTSTGNDIFLGPQSQQMTAALRPGARVMLENPQGQTVTEFALPA